MTKSEIQKIKKGKIVYDVADIARLCKYGIRRIRVRSISTSRDRYIEIVGTSMDDNKPKTVAIKAKSIFSTYRKSINQAYRYLGFMVIVHQIASQKALKLDSLIIESAKEQLAPSAREKIILEERLQIEVETNLKRMIESKNAYIQSLAQKYKESQAIVS